MGNLRAGNRWKSLMDFHGNQQGKRFPQELWKGKCELCGKQCVSLRAGPLPLGNIHWIRLLIFSVISLIVCDTAGSVSSFSVT